MSNLFGALGIADSERPFTSVEGRQIIWDATETTFQQWNRDVEDATRLFVQGTTINHQERYELAGGGELEEEGFEGAVTGSANRGGSWDVAYPLRNFGKSLSWTDVALSYLTMGQYEAAVQTTLNMNNNLVFRHILTAILKNTTTAFTDPIYGALTIQSLANGDSVVYPPVYGATAEATENLYVGTSYAESAISDANDPIKKVRDLLEPHYGFVQGGSPIVVVMNTSSVQYVQGLTNFDGYVMHNVIPGDNVSVPGNLDPALIPAGGRIVGVAWGCTLVEWPRCPSGVMIGVHADAPPPVKKRLDPPEMNLGQGLTLKARDRKYPFTSSHWTNRFGFGVGNRLGAVAINFTGNGTYSIPTGFSG